MAAKRVLSRYDAPMKSSFIAAAGAALLAAATAVPVGAHHSFAAEYDSTKSIKVTGEVVRLEWTNPHARVVVDGPDENGVKKEWDFELADDADAARLESKLAEAGQRHHRGRVSIEGRTVYCQRAHSKAFRWTAGVRGFVLRHPGALRQSVSCFSFALPGSSCSRVSQARSPQSLKANRHKSPPSIPRL